MKAYCVNYNPQSPTKSYEIVQLLEADNAIGLSGKDVLEVGGSLPRNLVFNEVGVKSWCAIESMDWNDLTGTANSPCIPLAEIGNIKDFPDYLLLNGLVEEIPDCMHHRFDRIISIAALEHVTHFPRALNRMFKALRPGGKLFAFIGPVWSAFNGHHLKEIKDLKGRIFKFNHDGIPPWGHLLYSPPEMYLQLRNITDEDTADNIIHEVYNTPAINRLFIEDYVNYFQASSFNILECSGVAKKTPDESIQKRLFQLYPNYKIFEFECLRVILEKPNKHDKKKDTEDIAPLVTIGLPVFNDATYLDEAIKSLLNQTYKNIEVIICDDASTDASFQIAQKLANEDTRIKLYKNEFNLGVTGNFNRIRSMGNGKYIILHSANDTIAPTLIEKSVKFLEENPSCALVTAKVLKIDTQGLFDSLPIQEMYYETMGLSSEESFLTVVQRFFIGDYNYGMIRRDIIRKAQAYRWCGGPDHIFIAEIALYGGLACIDEHLRRRRVFPSDSQNDRNFLSIRRVHHGRRIGKTVEDVFLKMKFIHMTYEHIQMLHNAHIEDYQKSKLAPICVEILRKRFGSVMTKELERLLLWASNVIQKIEKASSSESIGAYERLQVEEINRALAMAHMVFPNDLRIKETRLKLIEQSS